MPGAPSRQELFDDLSAFNRKLRAAFDALVREHGMTLSRARVFRKLSRRDGINQRELADELELETPTLVRILDAMEAQNFIERRAAVSDRRAKQIFMTESGKVVAAEVEALATGVRADILEGISDEDVGMALKVIRAMTANLQNIGKS
ncbi:MULTISPECIES: MarR family winged helix-turn-helix transcriptional regulator [Rhizobium]|uniref:MarR family transcriptional regulator, transcriptional regulator for hemolysin n=1 Tax=Rhizobium multihospitium TaxID=410764 RepID=A0A1C3V2G1_9HYPH|nr:MULTISPECIES: MarR family transcriptional regulator [Rhizobium]ASW06038.1 MarR family transcriptional regulator [Rhizobium sp. 11515TR]MDK4703150.1 MarR family transcriptional regulator [Rhizobium sp. CNPSo 4062]MDK4714521.1 MarR family transcriptional regulator [Rhizobium sp. CNPSo 4039]SCB21960.1 MarR family transcriptional regulator, transcriptional regulator for hemolysin [Rhizobium multihospitium]